MLILKNKNGCPVQLMHQIVHLTFTTIIIINYLLMACCHVISCEVDNIAPQDYAASLHYTTTPHLDTFS